MDQLRRARIRYRVEDTPVALDLCRQRSLQLTMNNFTEREPRLMDQMADAFHKVAENLDALRAYGRRRKRKS